MVKFIESLDEFNNVLTTEQGLVVFDFTATWCGPCRVIGPEFERLSTVYTNAKFYKVDVDDVSDVAEKCGIRAMPTFQFYKNGKKVAEFSGADKQKLEKIIAEHC
ncbi:thioredoxin-like [Spea bombifrons]|uniref:thioredoxin-like n=1 Tax=Spea bombifrons TaxID=233779 RepID=UPI0023494028|nr:thioredoxin-like [Spea bombifrons]